MSSLSHLEIALLSGAPASKTDGNSAQTTDIVAAVVDCRFRDALTSPPARALLAPAAVDADAPLDALFPLNYSEDDEAALIRVSVAAACLHAFVQANWTGPDLDIAPIDLISNSTSTPWSENTLHSTAISELASGGEPAYHLARVPLFLRLAQLLLEPSPKEAPSAPWWRLRVATVHQRILDSPTFPPPGLREALDPVVAAVAGQPELAGRLHLEIGLLEHTVGQDKIAGEDFIRAARATGLKYVLSGALGKRTKFQQNELSQLVLLAESSLPLESDGASVDNTSTKAERAPEGSASIPETLALNDDTLLEETAFTSSPAGGASALAHLDPASPQPLHALDQAILLALCLNVRNTQPLHGLTSAQMEPYVARVLTHPRNWSVHTMALLLRARLEANRTRTVERSALQLQALVDQMPTADASTRERLRWVHDLALPSRWEMEQELARRYMSIGVIKSALAIFERLELWADAVQCYASLEAPEKGIALVKDLLEGRRAAADAVVARAKAPAGERGAKLDAAREAQLWCLLGDLDTPNSAAHYTKAWEISRHTSARAMRALGGVHFAKGEWKDAIECLRFAVKINPLVVRAWFILGCACMRAEDWAGGREAFQRCVALDEEDGESWSNLASMYLRMGAEGRKQVVRDENDEEDDKDAIPADAAASIPFEHKLLAFRALRQGLRASYENWRMWANYALIALDVGELAEAARAIGRVVEQTDGRRGVDEDILERLVAAAVRTSPTAGAETGTPLTPEQAQSPNEGPALARALLALFEHTLLPRLTAPRVFRAYARLLASLGDYVGALKASMDGYRASGAAALQAGDEPEPEVWAAAVADVRDAVDALEAYGPRVEGARWRAQGKSLIRTFMGRMRNMEDAEGWTDLRAMMDEMSVGAE